MADQTHIEWTDATWNVVTGCSVVSPGCTNCYAMRLAGTRLRDHPSRAGLTVDSKAGPVWNGQVRFNEAWLTQPLRWRRPRRIFVAAHGDLFHEGVGDEQLDRIFAVMADSRCREHTFQILTKRPARLRDYIRSRFRLPDSIAAFYDLPTDGSAKLFQPLPNVWLGVSVEDQAHADERIPLLLDTPAAVRWISAEPLLGPIDLTSLCDGHSFWSATDGLRYHDAPDDVPAYSEPEPRLDWVVAGGESGPGARPMHPAWARQLRDQCAAAGVPFLFKQWGDWAPSAITTDWGEGSGQPFIAWPDGGITHGHARDHGGAGVMLRDVGKAAAGRLLDGQLHDAYPATSEARG